MQMRIFLSSTFEDLIEYRAKAASAVERLGQQGIRMEVFGARPVEATTACLSEIKDSDAFIGIYAHRYGFIPHNQMLSITEQEFDYASSLRKPIFCFVLDDNLPWLPRHMESDSGGSKLRCFKKRLSQNFVIETFTTAEDLAFKISSSLGRYLITTHVEAILEKETGQGSATTAEGRTQVARRAARLGPLLHGARLLLVNDVPKEMGYVVKLLQGLGVEVTVARSSAEGLGLLASGKFEVVVSDMERDGIPNEGLHFLKSMRSRAFYPLVIFTVGRFRPELGTPGYAFGITNRVDELLNLVFDAIERIKG
jgi:CheY-like chemotaxis protein